MKDLIIEKIARALGVLLMIVCVMTVIISAVGTLSTYERGKKVYADSHDNIIGNNASREEKQSSADDNAYVRTSKGVALPIFMYHEIVADGEREGNYAVSVSRLENDLKWLKTNGYQTLSMEGLRKLNKGAISDGKYCVLTFDDGYSSWLKYLPRLMEKYDMYCTVAVVGEYMEKYPNTMYMGIDQVKKLKKCGRIDIANHSYNYHHLHKGQKGAKMKVDEEFCLYKSRLVEDTKKAEKLFENGKLLSNVYAYPYGEYCADSEKILRELGYDITFTCREKINYIKGGDNGLNVLGRLNRKASYVSLQNVLDNACK